MAMKDKMKSRQSLYIAGIILLAIVLWVASGLVMPNDDEGKAPINQLDDSAINVPAQKVQTTLSRLAPFQSSLQLTGETLPSRLVTISAQTKGQITNVAGDIGDMFLDGETMIALSIGERPEVLEQAKALVAQTTIEYEASQKLAKQGFQSDIRKAQSLAALKAAKADLKQIELDLKKTQIRAPFDGVISALHQDKGAYVTEGTPVIEFLALNPLLINVQVAEKERVLIEVGQQVMVDIGAGGTYTGRLTRIAPTSDRKTRTFATEIEIDNPDNKLAGGLTAEVKIPLNESRAHRISPAWLTLNDAGEVGIKIVDNQNMAQFRKVTILADRVQDMWVTGLPDEIEIITVGQEFVKPGAPVDTGE